MEKAVPMGKPKDKPIVWTKDDLKKKRRDLESAELTMLEQKRNFMKEESMLEFLKLHPDFLERQVRHNMAVYQYQVDVAEGNVNVIKKQLVKIQRNFKEEKKDAN